MSNRCTIKQSKRSRPNIPTAILNLPRKPPKDPQGMTCKISWFHFGGLKSSSSHSHDSLEGFHGAQMPQHQCHIFSGGWLSKSCTRITKHHQTSEMMRGNARAFFYPILKLGRGARSAFGGAAETRFHQCRQLCPAPKPFCPHPLCRLHFGVPSPLLFAAALQFLGLDIALH